MSFSDSAWLTMILLVSLTPYLKYSYYSLSTYILLSVDLKLLNILLKLVKQFILSSLIRSEVFLHKQAVFDSALNDINCIFVVFINSKLLVNEIVGFSLLGCKFWWESKRHYHDRNNEVSPETSNNTDAAPEMGGWIEVSIAHSCHSDNDTPHAIP